MVKNILINLGSPSDKRILNKIGGFDLSSVNIYTGYASAHRTPELVEEYATSRKWDAIIAGAGFNNILANSMFKYVDVTTQLVALPITDPDTEGLSSLLSTQELPPGYPIATVGINNINAALNFAIKAVTKKFDHVTLVYENKSVLEQGLPNLKDIVDILSHFRIDSETMNIEEAKKKHDEIILHTECIEGNIFSLDKTENTILATYPFQGLRQHKRGGKDLNHIKTLYYLLQNVENTAYFGFRKGKNLGLYVAKMFAQHDDAIAKKVREYLEDGKKKYEGEYKGLKSFGFIK